MLSQVSAALAQCGGDEEEAINLLLAGQVEDIFEIAPVPPARAVVRGIAVRSPWLLHSWCRKKIAYHLLQETNQVDALSSQKSASEEPEESIAGRSRATGLHELKKF